MSKVISQNGASSRSNLLTQQRKSQQIQTIATSDQTCRIVTSYRENLLFKSWKLSEL